jgi:hypothetical protein
MFVTLSGVFFPVTLSGFFFPVTLSGVEVKFLTLALWVDRTDRAAGGPQKNFGRCEIHLPSLLINTTKNEILLNCRFIGMSY